MSTRLLVTRFYERIWNAGDKSAVDDLLIQDFRFRGSLGRETKGQEHFWNYVCEVRACLAGYHCEILACVCEEAQAFAKMRFSGLHIRPLRGFEASGLHVQWDGAALFEFKASKIGQLWVLGDLFGLGKVLVANEFEARGGRPPPPQPGCPT